MSTTSLVARQFRLREWASMIRECNNRPSGMSVDEWCRDHSITKANYYYRLKQVRKTCIESFAEETDKQAVVPIPMELMTVEAEKPHLHATKAESSLELNVHGIILHVTEQTSEALLKKVLGVVVNVK